MFTSVGQPVAPRERAVPFLLAVLLNAAAIGALLVVGAQTVERVVEAEPIERPYELRVPAPAPAAGAPAGKPAPKATPKPAPKAPAKPTVDAPMPPAPLPEPVQAEVAAVAVVPAPADGADAGPEGGTGTGGGGIGPGDGEGGGTGDGTGLGDGTSVRTVHWSEVSVRVRPQVRPSDYPPAAAALDLPDTRCVVRIRIDEAGRPADVRVKTCPEVFRASAEAVARRYRFHPLLDERGRPVQAGFDLTLNFRRGD